MKKWIPFWVWPILVCLSVATVWLRLTIVKLSYEIGQTDKLVTNARMERDELNLMVARLKSPKRLEILARNRFGLQPPRTEQTVTLKENQP